jgi:hypothetical protein
MTPAIIDNRPLFDLFQRPKAAEASKVIVEAAISDARRLGGTVVFAHEASGADRACCI